MSFTITNNGATIVTGDTLYFALVIGTTYYTVDFANSNSVSGTILTQDFTSGSTFPIAVPTKTMDEIYNLLGGLTGNLCGVVLGVGAASVNNQFADDATPADNLACSQYTVTAVSGVEEEVVSEIKAYPNPVVTNLNIDLGNNTNSVVKIIDMSGREIASVNASGSIVTIDMSAFNSGVYFYQVISNGVAVKTEKFIVTK